MNPNEKDGPLTVLLGLTAIILILTILCYIVAVETISKAFQQRISTN
jgi:hypothetical protein